MRTLIRGAALFASLALVIGAGVALGGCGPAGDAGAPEGSQEAEAGRVAASATGEDAAGLGSAGASDEDAPPVAGAMEGAGDEEAARGLIGQSLSRDEIEAAVGTVARFEMSNEGCERGVYKGIFYYDDFTIFSRTYDMGQRFTVVSVNEAVVRS